MTGLPTGTVTFLFTDIEGSTKRWEQHREVMQAALARHDTLLRETIEANGGYIFKTMGDAFYAAFPTAPQALSAALHAQHALLVEQWPQAIGSVRVRMALHTGSAEERGGDYFGPPVNRVARLLSAGHGGQVLLSEVTQGLVRGAGGGAMPALVTLQDMGEHRLKDLTEPEHIYQVVAPDLPSEFPPLRTLDAHPHNLPLQPTALIGREKELEEVRQRLMREDVRLLTLTGPGGTGKTRLGLQVAAEVIEEFADGVYFVNLAPIGDPNLVASGIAQTLGVLEAGGKPLIDTLKEYLRDKQVLLLLDNFEQVVKAGPLVTQLTQSAPHLKVLVTSRVPLRVRGEREYPVPPLGLPPDLKHLPLFEELTQYEAVRLFIERATDVKPDFQVTNENAPAVAEICYRLDGLPLAIELAAARIRILPPQTMLSRLQSRLKLLTGGGRDLPARQQTLRGAIEWSYDLLDEEERKLFRRLAVFVGGRSLEAIEAVCNAEGDLEVDVLDGVESLAAKSLLRQEEGIGGDGGEPRFVMLETIHEYAREKLEESGEEEEMRRQHARYFLALAEEAEPQLMGPKRSEWLDRLEEELDNFRAVHAWLIERAKEPKREEPWGQATREEAEAEAEKALRLSAAFFQFWFGRHYEEGRRWLEEALASSSLASSSVASRNVRLDANRAKALRAAGLLAYWQGDNERARSSFEELLATARQQGDKNGIAEALKWLGHTSADVEEALALYEESLALYRELGDKVGIGSILTSLGERARQQGEYDQAIALYEESLRLVGEEGNEVREVGAKQVLSMAIVRNNLGFALYNRGDLAQADYARARAAFTQALTLWRELSMPQGSAHALVGLAGVAQAHGEPARAARLLAAAQVMLETTGGVLDTGDRPDHERIVETARAQMDEEAWEKAWQEGRAMSMEQAVSYALEETIGSQP